MAFGPPGADGGGISTDSSEGKATVSVKSALSSAAVLLAGALALTACQSDSDGTAAGPSSSTTSSPSSAQAGSRTPSASPTTQPASAATSAPASTRPPLTTAPTRKSATAPASTDSDTYAFKHPCAIGALSVHVTVRAGAPTQRVIAVRNTGAHACGLSYYPLVDLDGAASGDGATAVKPLVPGGLGGAPAYVVHAGQTAYAVVDLDPSGASTGTAAGVDELNVLPDGDHMPTAQTLNFPLGKGALVRGPKLGLYRSTVSDAVASMRTADTRP